MSNPLSVSLAWSKIVEETISKLQMSLIENANVSEKYLNMISRIFRPQDYLAVVEERSSLYCGFPTCKTKLKLDKKLVYDEECGKLLNSDESLINMFCSIECYKKSSRFAMSLDDSPPYTRKIRELVKLVFPEMDLDKVFKSINDIQAPVQIVVKEKMTNLKFEPPSKRIDKIEGHHVKREIQPQKGVHLEEQEEEYEDPFQQDEDEKYRFKMSTWQIVWSELSHWVTLDSIEYFETGRIPDLYDTSFQVFNESILKRSEVVLEKTCLVIPMLCEKYKFSNMEKILNRIQEATSLFNFERPLSSLDTNQWNLIGMVLIRASSMTDPLLIKEFERNNFDFDKLFDVNHEQFKLLVELMVKK